MSPSIFKGTLDFGILYQGSIDSMIAEHIDLNWVILVDTRKSETGYVFTLGLGRQFHGKVSYNLQFPYPPLTYNTRQTSIEVVRQCGYEEYWLIFNLTKQC